MIVGIDLGTTNSLCAVFQDGAPRLVPNSLGGFLTPSVVAVLDDGAVLVGEAARELRVTQPQRCASCFKRLMGSGEKLTLAGREFTAPELSSLVLGSLKHDAEVLLGEPVTEAVVTVPAYFNDNQRKATRLAGRLAGLKVRRIVNEPTAAALCYGLHDRDAEKRLLVVDLGGGTFDVTLMEVFEGTLEIISTSGESFLGGEDFTERLVAVILKRDGVQLEVAELKQPLRVARLRQQCEAAKRALGAAEEARVALPDEAGNVAPGGATVKVTRKAFADAVRPLVERIEAPVAKALRDGRASPGDVDEVILVGGATRMAPVREFVERYFSKAPLTKINPDEVVCLGAAVQAALIADDRAVEDMVMTDVCPFTLGVDSAKEIGAQLKSGYFVPVIHRNTTIPVSKEHPFATIAANQRTVRFDVYQGEHRRVEQNLKIGSLEVTGVPAGPAGQTVWVRFTYDLNGILEVEAYAEGASDKFSTVITSHAAELDEDDLAEALRKMQALKYYPREDMANQRLLRMGERLTGEVSPFHREQLEQALDALERAMGEGDKELVESTRQFVLETFSMLGFEVDEE
ncbi:Chaperone protein HscC [Pirellulimonas nuda]|uniref:Chaperone protein HscC n=1 Tax=Pirellulimonas nuda TaxID=2528009 RepID=A0A518D670_9BACT|nr:molecular chaperone HscC [Pirellulimonas nuda]QDU86968.1 Chaperone protein HscC [Pirellulimonas nuda]